MSREKYSGPKVTNTDAFIQKSRWVHGQKYDYSKSVYSNSENKVIIHCKDHGDFYQTPHSHLRGYGCRQCGFDVTRDKLIKNKEDFVKDAKEVHGEKYDYSLVIYKGSFEKVVILCKQHGSFLQSPTDHLSGKGCEKCGTRTRSKKKSLTTNEFISRSKEIHGDRYDYSISAYRNSKEKVKIECREHGVFSQLPHKHMSGAGCWDCGKRLLGKNPNSAWGLVGFYGTEEESQLYILLVDNGFIKVGLSKNVPSRVTMLKREVSVKVKILHQVKGKANSLYLLEQRILRKSNLIRFKPSVQFTGSTECLELSELPKVLQIIEDWEKSNEESFSETS